MRIALLGSPRCGNNWVRRVMSDTLGYPHFAAHSIEEFPQDLPSNCILNIHALNGPTERIFFEKHSCKLIVLARHPLDVFVSVLQFARNEPAVHRWLGGSCEIPRDNVATLCPDDTQFVEWMTGNGARNLLSVSLSWWQDKQLTIRLRYEDLVSHPHEMFNSVFNSLNAECNGSLEEALAKYTVSYFAQFKNHGWLGRPQNYVKFITKANCHRVHAAQSEYFLTMGYNVQNGNGLTHEMAREQYFASLPPV
jgi:Sulfotransferase domain